MDQIKFHYEKTAIPNVLIQYNKERAKYVYDREIAHDPSANVSLYPKAVIKDKAYEFVSELAKDNPQWTFLGIPNHHQYGAKADVEIPIVSFRVEQNGEQLGAIRVDDMYRNGERTLMYQIENDRINAKRVRGSAVVTKHMKRAIRVIKKEFGTKTVDEHISQSVSNIKESIARQLRGHDRVFANTFSKYMGALQTHVILNLDKFNPIVIANGSVDPSVVAELPLNYERFEIAENIQIKQNRGDGAYVTILESENKYLIAKASDNSISTFTTDTVPPTIKQAIGMLKLIEDGEFLRDVGYRQDRKTFYVAESDGSA